MYNEKQQKTMDSLDKGLKKVERQAQKNLNSRLDNMRFCDYTRAEFNSSAPHADTDISFVLETDQTISLYKGDTQLSSQGSNVDVLYAALVGYGTGLGGERTGNDTELIYGLDKDIRNTTSLSYRGRYNQPIAFWTKGEYGEVIYYGNDSVTTNTRLTAYGLEDFRSGTTPVVPIICNRTKAVVSQNVRGTDGDIITGSSSTDFLPYTSFLYRKTFYVRHIVDGVYGPRETLTFSVEPYGLYFDGNQTSRTVRTYGCLWKIKVSDGTNERYLNGVYQDSPSQYMLADNSNGMLPNAGFNLGFESVQHTDDDILYGQLRGPGLLWRGVKVVKETPDNPYGFYYDVSTGAAIAGEPTVEFYNKDERNMAYCLCLPRSVDI